MSGRTGYFPDRARLNDLTPVQDDNSISDMSDDGDVVRNK
jgi:hypothetical protein